jgi:hypothetical protein
MYAPGAFGSGDPSGGTFDGINVNDYFSDDFQGYD